MATRNLKPLTAAERKAILDEPEPSAESLREMPEFDFSKSTGRGKEGLRKALELMRARKAGRPRKGVVSARDQATRTKSIRLPEWVWRELARRAKAQRTTVAAVVRDVLADWLERTGS